jgi:hypothetical protein
MLMLWWDLEETTSITDGVELNIQVYDYQLWRIQ